jgi:hypothetical protein
MTCPICNRPFPASGLLGEIRVCRNCCDLRPETLRWAQEEEEIRKMYEIEIERILRKNAGKNNKKKILEKLIMYGFAKTKNPTQKTNRKENI